jgi:GxxExxY protein
LEARPDGESSNRLDGIDGRRSMDARLDDPLTGKIIGCAMKVHRRLGPGFLETVYRRALLHELRIAHLRAEEEDRVSVYYDGVSVGEFIADIMVEGKLILELKAVESLSRAHEIQTVNYLTATGLELGLLINFGAHRLQFKRKRSRNRLSRLSTEALSPSAESSSDNPVNPVKSVALPPTRAESNASWRDPEDMWYD